MSISPYNNFNSRLSFSSDEEGKIDRFQKNPARNEVAQAPSKKFSRVTRDSFSQRSPVGDRNLSPLKKLKLVSPNRNHEGSQKLAFERIPAEEESAEMVRRPPQAGRPRAALPVVDDHIAALLRPVDTTPLKKGQKLAFGEMSDDEGSVTPRQEKQVSRTRASLPEVDEHITALIQLQSLRPEATSPFGGYKDMPPPTPARKKRPGKENDSRVNGFRPDPLAFSPFSAGSSFACPPTPFKMNRRSALQERRMRPVAIEGKQTGIVRPTYYRSASGYRTQFQIAASIGSGQHTKVHPVVADQPLFSGYSNEDILMKFYKQEVLDQNSERRIESFLDGSLMQYRLSQSLNEALLKLDMTSKGIDVNSMGEEEYNLYRMEMERFVGYPTVKILNAETVKKDLFFAVEKMPHKFKVDTELDPETLRTLSADDVLAQVKRFFQISYDPLDYLASKVGGEFYREFKDVYHPYLQSGNYEEFKSKYDSHSPLDGSALFYEALKNLFYPHLQIDDAAFYENLKKLYPDAQKSNFMVRADGTVVLIDFMEHQSEEKIGFVNGFTDLLHNCLTTFSGDVKHYQAQEALYRYLMPAGWTPSFELGVGLQ